MDHLGGPNIIMRVHTRGRREDHGRRSDNRSRGWTKGTGNQETPAASRDWKRRETNFTAARRSSTFCSPHENHFWTFNLRKHMKINGFCFKSPSLWSFVTVAIGKQHTPPSCGLTPHRRSGDFLFHNDPSAVGSLNQEARQPDQLQPPPLVSRATLQTVSQLLCHLLMSHTEPPQGRVPYNGRENPRRDGPSSQTWRGSP